MQYPFYLFRILCSLFLSHLNSRTRTHHMQTNKKPTTDTWDTNATLDDCAQAVKGEYPGHHQAIAAHQLFTEGLEMHRDMSPFRSVIDFVGTEVRISCINSWAIDAVSAINFMLKWYVGMPRPEEIAWMVSCGAFTTDDGVPDDIIASVQSMKLNNAEEFTAYSDGSPMHPSYPAMHAAASSLSYWLPAVAKVTPEQYCECLRVDYATAYARTVAGVHYPMDNIAGLNIGQRIVQEQLPAMMAEKYGYDAAKVRTRLDALAFDWNQFDPHECTINGISIAIFLHQAYRAGLS